MDLKGLKEVHSCIYPNWLDVPPEVMTLILQRVGCFEVWKNIRRVCKYWFTLSKDPFIWRVIEIRQRKYSNIWRKKPMSAAYICEEKMIDSLETIARHVVDFSGGQLLDLYIEGFGSDYLLQDIYQQSSKLRRFCLIDCLVIDYDWGHKDHYITVEGLTRMLKNLPMLEELQLPFTRFSAKFIEAAGCCCPHLKSFTLNQRASSPYIEIREIDDHEALAIAENMSGLRHLQLVGNRMTLTGLLAILNNCHHLESLDIRRCYNIGTALILNRPHLGIKISQQIKHVRLVFESLEDYDDYHFYDSDSD